MGKKRKQVREKNLRKNNNVKEKKKYLGVVNVAGAEVSLGSDPVAGVILAGPLAGAGVVAVVEALLLRLGDPVHEVVRALVGDVGVLLEEESVLGDLERDVVGGVLLVHHAEREVGALGALGGRLGVTVSVSGGGVGRGVDGRGAVGGGGRVDGVVRGGVVHRVHQLVRPDEGRDEDEETCNLANLICYTQKYSKKSMILKLKFFILPYN